MAEAATFFISYRRDDSAGHVGRLYDTLSSRFGASQIFVDIDHIGPGEDFVRVLDGAVAKSLVMLVIIGKRWLADESGYSRLQNPGDWVRLEIVAGLQRGLRVIPVLVQGASMPGARDLPHDLRDLTARNAFELSDLRWREDVQRLIAELERIAAASYKESAAAAKAAAAAKVAERNKTRAEHVDSVNTGDAAKGKGARWSLIFVAALLLVAGGWWAHRRSEVSPYNVDSSASAAPDAPDSVAEKALTAKAEARRWRSDAELYLVNVTQDTASSGARTFRVGYSFVSPRDMRILTIVDGASGHSFYPSNQPYNGRFYPIATPFMDLSEAIASAKRNGMSTPFARGSLYWRTPSNRASALVWTVVPTDQRVAAPAYNINAITGVFVPIPQLID